MVFKLFRNPVYQVVMSMLLLAGCVVWGFDLGGLKTLAMSIGQVGHVGLVGVLVAMPAIVAPFPVDPELTAVSVAYRNTSLIQDEVFPRVPVGLQSFKYKKYALADGFTIPDTKVGRTSSVNKVEFGFTETDSSTNDYGLGDDIPGNDIVNAPKEYDPQSMATMSITDLLLLDREKRCADLAFATASYAASQREALVGIAQFNDYANSDPIAKLLTILDKMVMRGTVMVIGQPVWTVLRMHPKVVSAILGNSGTAGVISKEQLAEKLELKKVVVGSGWYNSAKKGQAPVMQRLWGKSIAIHYQDKMATTRDRITFGLTAQWQDRFVGAVADPKLGLRGGVSVTVGESVKELVTADDLGYLVSDAIA